MKAVYIQETGSSDKMVWGDLPVPRPGAHEVLIAVGAVSVNYVDTFIRSGLYKTQLPQPFVVGRDAVGKIVAVGRDVTRFKVGDQVWTNSMGYDGRQGVTSEFVAIPEDRAFNVPEHVDTYQLVGAIHSAATAAIVVEDIMNLQAGDWLLIEGAAGHVGKKLVSLAKDKGAHVVTTSNRHDFEDLQQLGADDCLDYHSPGLWGQLQRLCPEGFDHIIDTSGQIDLQQNLDLLGLHGMVTIITKPKTSEFNAQHFYMKAQHLKGFVISHASLEQLQRAGDLLNANFAKGKLLEEHLVVMPMSQAKEAHGLLDNRLEKRKIVLKP